MKATPSVTIKRRGVNRWKRQHPWIYRSDIQKVDAESGDVVRVRANSGATLGWAFYSEPSEISLRRVARGKEALAPDTWSQRIQRAEERRQQLLPPDTKVYRLLHGEADGIPATIIDRYDDIFVIQTLCASSDRLRPQIVQSLQELFSPQAIVERNDVKVRQLEGLPQQKSILHGALPDYITVPVGRVRVRFEPLEGQKTGAYLDQLQTMQRTMPFLHNTQRVLEACSYQGWFTCNAASHHPRPNEVFAIDSSASAIETLRKNAELNQLSEHITTFENNVFEQLREFDREGQTFDLIFLDPPSFIKNRGALQAGLRGYKELNLRSLRLLPPGGILVSSSCSYHLSREAFWSLLQEAAADQQIDLQLLEIWGQGLDHPCLANFPESDYLKTLVVQRLS